MWNKHQLNGITVASVHVRVHVRAVFTKQPVGEERGRGPTVSLHVLACFHMKPDSCDAMQGMMGNVGTRLMWKS